MHTELVTQPDFMQEGVAAGDYKVIPLVAPPDYRERDPVAGNQALSPDDMSSLAQRVDALSFHQQTPSYGDVSRRPGYREVNDLLQRAVRAAEKDLNDVPAEQRDWAAVQRAFQLCPLLVAAPEGQIDRADEFMIKRKNWFKKQAEYSSVAEEVSRWFTRFILDSDLVVARGTTDLKAIQGIVAHAGRIFGGNMIFKKERAQRTLLDIGVLRYPDIHQPYVKVYRIELIAWYESRVVMGRARDKNGIMAQFNLRQYQPHEESIEDMRGRMKQLAIDNVAKQLATG